MEGCLLVLKELLKKCDAGAGPGVMEARGGACRCRHRGQRGQRELAEEVHLAGTRERLPVDIHPRAPPSSTSRLHCC